MKIPALQIHVDAMHRAKAAQSHFIASPDPVEKTQSKLGEDAPLEEHQNQKHKDPAEYSRATG